MRVHSIEERIASRSRYWPQISLASPSCEVVKREESHNYTRLDATSAPRTSAVYLWNFEVEDSLLASLFALANVQQDYDWGPRES